MVTSYGSFPGVRVEVAGGGITAVSIGAEEKLVIFGEASYARDEPDFSTVSDGSEDALQGDASPETAVQINARREADTNFGDGSELANGMREALANGANVNYLYAVAPRRLNVVGELQSTQSGTLANAPIYEEDVSDEANIAALEVSDTTDGAVSVRYSYESPPAAPTDVDTVAVNPLTGEYNADATPAGDYEFNYKYLDWQGALDASEVTRIVEEGDTGVYDILSDSDSVSSTAASTASTRRDAYQLVNVLSGAQPNSNENINDDDGNYVRRDARYDTSAFVQGSVDADYYFKVAPPRLENVPSTILGGIGGLFAGNPINDPIYNDPVSGYAELEQKFTKADADNMRGSNVIPVRQAGSIRVKDNTSTSTATDWERDFWRRRIADRVILIGKLVGDSIIGRINDEQTRSSAERLIRAELRELADDSLLKPNADGEQNYYVDVYESSTNSNEVKIDIGFTPYGIVKRIDESIVIST